MLRHAAATLALTTVLILVTACQSGHPTSPYAGYLEEQIPPCVPALGSSVDPCEPHSVVETSPLRGLASGGIFSKSNPQTIREYLDGSISFIPHIVLRGTFLPDTVRCDAGVPNREPSYVEPGGYFEHSVVIQCYVDVRVNDYVLGVGPPRLPVLVAYWHYFRGEYARGLPVMGLETEEDLVEAIRATYVRELEDGPVLNEGPRARGDGIYGRERILFLGPAHNATTEAWEIFDSWGLERQEDGTVVAVHPERNRWRVGRSEEYQTYRSLLEMELPPFTQEVKEAHQARLSEYGGRIAPEDVKGRAEGVNLPVLINDANDLSQFMKDTGAYAHPDGPPVLPPPP